MARPIVPIAERCSAQIHVLLPPSMLENLDLASGGRSRSDFVRAAIAAAIQRWHEETPSDDVASTCIECGFEEGHASDCESGEIERGEWIP